MILSHDEITAAYDRLMAPAARKASAAKRGSNPNFPYVPVIAYLHNERMPKTHNPIRGFAFATREEAISHAQRYLDDERALVCARIAEPRCRALREQYGLPREID